MFSAALPAILTRAAIDVIDFLETDQGKETLQKLRTNVESFRRAFGILPGIQLEGDARFSPIIHLRLTTPSLPNGIGTDDEAVYTDEEVEMEQRRDLESQMQDVVNQMLNDHEVVVARAKYVENYEHNLPQPSVRIYMSPEFSTEEVTIMAKQLRRVVSDVFRLPNTDNP